MIKRQLSAHIKRLSKSYPVVTITGPRQSGKTTLCRAVFPNYDYCNLEDLEKRQFALEDPKGFLAQFSGSVILDEIQRAPDLPSYIQVLVDESKRNGQFILTGSQQFEVTQSINQSLAGRTALCTLLPLTLQEAYGNKTPDLVQTLYTGFYPRIFDQNLNPSEASAFYFNTYIERDIRTLLNIQNLNAFERFVKCCATQIGQLLNMTSLANDVGVDQKTIKSWLSLLEASYVIFLLQPHYQSFRKRLTKSPKLYFHDVGLAAYLLGIQNPQHVSTSPSKGLLFENLIISECLKHRYNSVQRNDLYFYRDHTGNEVDLIIDRGQSVQGIEIKMGNTIKSDFFKGLDFYQSLAGEKLKSRTLIYGGDNKPTHRNETHIYSYKDIEMFFQETT